MLNTTEKWVRDFGMGKYDRRSKTSKPFVYSSAQRARYLTPLPGTKTFDRYRDEERLLYTDFPSDWVHYDMSEVTYKPLLMNHEELTKAMRETIGRLYDSWAMRHKFMKTWRATRSMKTAMWAYTSNKNYHNVAYGTAKSEKARSLFNA